MIPVAPVLPVLTDRSAVSVVLMIPVAPVLPGLRVAAVLPTPFPDLISLDLRLLFIDRCNKPLAAAHAKIRIISEFSPVFPPTMDFSTVYVIFAAIL
jgi:hypothetical protein